MKSLDEKIKDQILQVINKTIFKEKKKIFQFQNISLYPSEVHLMMVIEDKIHVNATEIAKRLGLTKGAISQTLSRLEKKGIIVKRKDIYKKNELILSLTDLGKEAYRHCQSKQMPFSRAHQAYLDGVRPEDKHIILQFLLHMEKAIDDLDLS